MQRFLITGKKGLISRGLQRRLAERHEVVTLARECDDSCLEFDLQHPESFDYTSIKPDDVVVHAAAISSPDACVSGPEIAKQVNVDGSIIFMERCIERGARVVFLSTDLVFGSGKGKNERSEHEPAGLYAEMKQAVEERFHKSAKVKVVRLSYVISLNDKYMKYLSSCVANNEVAEVFDPFYRNTVALADVCEAIERMGTGWERFDWYSVNLCGPDLLSRKALAEIYRQVVDPRLEYTVVHPGKEFFAERPEVLEVVSERLEDLLGHPASPIGKALENELKNC